MINQRVLRFREVRLIASDGKQVGIVGSREALGMAEQEGLDLVLVTATANPPVCRIIDYGKFKYDQDRKEKEHKRKQQEVKGIKISPRIAENDVAHLLKNTRRFLEEGHKVKVTCQFKAREVTHPEIGQRKLQAMADVVADLAVIERQPTLDGKLMIMVLVPKPRSGKSHGSKAENQQDGRQAVQDHGLGQDNPPEGLQQPPVPAQESVAEATA
ncbi:MAG: translation initiation factor IF-3 [Armatimonadetes bacterium]|nr:translation initiation factor IF-3 [Armatimonadota bacterium]